MPITIEQIKGRMDEEDYIEVIITYKLEKIFGFIFAEEFENDLSDALTGEDTHLRDIEYTVVGYEDDNVLLLKVTGNAIVAIEQWETENE